MRPTASGGAGHQHKKEARTWSLGPATPRLPGLTPPRCPHDCPGSPRHTCAAAHAGTGPLSGLLLRTPTLGISTASQPAPGLRPCCPDCAGPPPQHVALLGPSRLWDGMMVSTPLEVGCRLVDDWGAHGSVS